MNTLNEKYLDTFKYRRNNELLLMNNDDDNV